MFVVFAGGGTGGHLYPAIAVADALRRLQPRTECEFWGAGRELEREIFRKEEVHSRALPSAAMPRNPLALPRFAKAVLSGYRESRSLLSSLGASAVVGLGGYSSFAPVCAARRLGLPAVLLEQNVVPGKANSVLSRWASLVCLTWEASLERLPRRARARVTGNPLRLPIVRAAAEFTYNPRGGILILGGSTGAVGLNDLVIESLPVLKRLPLRITHQTGRQDLERVRLEYGKAKVAAEVTAFIDDMAAAYSEAALVIARAGGTTLSELALFGLPAVLVPYPHHKDYHQMYNAKVFTDNYAAEIIEERSGARGILAPVVERLVEDPARLHTMHASALALGKPDAAERVASELISLVEATTSNSA